MHVIKADGVEVELQSFLTWAANGGEWLAVRFGRFTSGKEDPNFSIVQLRILVTILTEL